MDDFAFDFEKLSAADPELRRSDVALERQQWANALAHAEQEAARLPAGASRARALLTATRAQWHLDNFLGSLKLAVLCLANRDSQTPATLSVHALTLAAFALNELGATQEARPLAQRALVTARLESLFDLLPTALSCAAHVDSCGGDLDRAEALHIEALSHARKAADKLPLQMALDNLLMSYIELLRDASRRGDFAMAEAVRQRSRRHVAQARLLAEDPDLPQWRRLSLAQSLGELLGLGGDPAEGERLLSECLVQSTAAADAFSTQAIATALAEQLEMQGRHSQALEMLRAHVHHDDLRRGSYRRRLLALRTAESCLRHLGLDAEAARMSERIGAQTQQWLSLRQEAIQCLAAAGVPGGQPV
jgi:hypothetical protein